MSVSHRITSAAFTCLLGSLAMHAVLCQAIELRSSSGGRPIVRSVSTGRMDMGGPLEEGEYIEAEPAVLDSQLACEAPCAPCGPVCAPVGAPCCPGLGESIWAEFDFLLWWREGRSFPPLATTPTPGTLPNATVLFGGDQMREQSRPGGRLEVGMWLDPWAEVGIGGHLVMVDDSVVAYAADSQSLDFLARPFFNVDPGQYGPNAQVIFNPNQPGRLDVHSVSEFQAADAFLRCLMVRTPVSRLDFLVGYQFGRLDEDLLIHTFTQGANQIQVQDLFATRNEFHGAHIGFQGDCRFGAVGLELLAKFGFGNMRHEAALNGTTAVDGVLTQPQSGLLVQKETNAGVYSQDEFSFMEDVGIKLTYYPVERIKLSLGYSLMFFSDVVRPGDAVNLQVDGRLFGPDASEGGIDPPADAVQPAFRFDTTHFYVHGINLGMEYRF